MKKIIVFFLLLVCLAACGDAQKAETLPAEYDANVSISISDREYEAVYEKRADYDRLVFSAPESLAGLDVTLRGNVATVKIGDITFESQQFSGLFDFLPVEKSGIKTVGNREYTIEIEGSME